MIYRPAPLPESAILSLIQSLYGLYVKFLRELESYDDRNYLIEVVPDSSLSQETILTRPSRCVLKVLNSVVSREPQKINMQNEVILFANKAGYPAPAPLRNQEGSLQKLMTFEDKARGVTESLLVRMFEYYPGSSLEKVTLTKPLCYQIGHFAGWLDKIYQSYHDYDEPTAMILKSEWNLAQLPTLRPLLDVFQGDHRLIVVENVISALEQDVLKNEDRFSKGFIHSDIHECNLIVRRGSGAPSGIDKKLTDLEGNQKVLEMDQTYNITGVIDFAEFCYSCHLYEAAISIAYVLMNENGIPPFEAARCVLSGYQKHIQLSDFELQRLKVCVCARFTISLVMGLNSHKANPDNDYTLLHSRRVWEHLEKFWSMSNEDFLRCLLKEIQ